MIRVDDRSRRHHRAVQGRKVRALPSEIDLQAAKVELRIAAGRELYGEGQPSVAPYLVIAGLLRVSVALIDGRERLVDLVGPGDVVGTAALEAAEHAETVVAAEGGAVVAQLDLAEALASRSSRKHLTSALVRQLVRSREFADDLGLPMGARICRILARLAIRLGESYTKDAALDSSPEGWRHLPFTLTHDDVALLAGCARVTATRVMGDLKDAGVLNGSRGDYALVPSALLRAADDYVCDVI